MPRIELQHSEGKLELNYLDHMKVRLSGNESHVPASYGDKRKVRNIAKLLGIRTSEIYYDGELKGIDWNSLPNEFVIKPSFASTSIGVFLLQRVDKDTFKNLMTNQTVSISSLEDTLRDISERYYNDRDCGSFLVEELLRDIEGSTPPKDIRAYSFFGKIGMILMEDHLTKEYAEACYYDENFDLFPDVEKRYGVAPNATHLEHIVNFDKPKNSEEIIKAAERVSTAVPSAFCRVDLYNTPKGVYLGEITFYPGTFFYRDRKLMHGVESERLGKMWDAAVLEIAETGILEVD